MFLWVAVPTEVSWVHLHLVFRTFFAWCMSVWLCLNGVFVCVCMVCVRSYVCWEEAAVNAAVRNTYGSAEVGCMCLCALLTLILNPLQKPLIDFFDSGDGFKDFVSGKALASNLWWFLRIGTARISGLTIQAYFSPSYGRAEIDFSTKISKTSTFVEHHAVLHMNLTGFMS